MILQKEKHNSYTSKKCDMDTSPSSELDSNVSELKSETQASKRRKVAKKTVVTVQIEANAGKGKVKNGEPPSDLWSWRKYGQKPIKGSPYPRGYYRCSTSKGRAAKKQVDRCRTDSSLLIITYTCSHNHPVPDHLHNKILNHHPQQHPSIFPEQELEDEIGDQYMHCIEVISPDKDGNEDHSFHYVQSPINSSQDIMSFIIENPEEKTLSSPGLVLDEEPISSARLMTFSAPKSEENDFFDELEELPSYSYLNTTTRSKFFE